MTLAMLPPLRREARLQGWESWVVLIAALVIGWFGADLAIKGFNRLRWWREDTDIDTEGTE